MEPAPSEIDPKYHFLSEDQVMACRTHTTLQYLDSWWLVHPEKGLAFWGKGYGSPQCNRNKQIAERLKPKWAETKFIDRVIVPMNISDYVERQ